MNIKEVIKRQFGYCNAIAEDILANGKTKEAQEYAQQFAEIESPLVGGTDAEWIRINWGDIYIFLHDDESSWYQLDGLGEYGGELINAESVSEFMSKLEKVTDEEILDHSYMENNNGDYSEYAPKGYFPFVCRAFSCEKKEGDGNKKYEIEITYSFDDGIESMGYFNTPEEAYERMCQVAATEAYVQGSEFFPEQNCIVYFHPSEKRIALHYLSDDEWCYYRINEMED